MSGDEPEPEPADRTRHLDLEVPDDALSSNDETISHWASRSFGPQTASGSATISPTVRRGFSDEIGSWKIICMSVRRARRLAGASVVRSTLPSCTRPSVGGGS